MMGNWRRTNWKILLLTILLCFSMSAAYASEAEDYGLKYLKNDDPALVDVDIIDFKVKLYELGFYSAGVSDSTLQSKELDDLTMAAVKLVCSLNPELTYRTDGVSNMLYWRVMGIVDTGELKTPLDEQYHVLAPGNTGDAVTKVQNRLNQLGYDAAGYTFTPGVYDDELQGAVDSFVRCNKFVYERKDGITVEMQELLFSDEAQPYTAEADASANASLSEKVFGFLGSTGNFMGMKLPMPVILLIGFGLLCVIVLLVLKLLMPGSAKPNPKKTKSGELIFKIEYGSDVYVHRVDMKKYIRIGRSTGDFPLNMGDESVSRRHCEICYENGSLMLRDFSSYGTMINGKMCHHSQQVLHSGDVMEIGAHRITVEFDK